MLTINISDVAHQLVQQELVGKGRENEALYFCFDLRMQFSEGGVRFWQSRGLHLLYHLRPDMASISVFSCVVVSPFAKIKDIVKNGLAVGTNSWTHETTHDSCWRDIRVFTRTYFDMAQCINDVLREEVAPAAMNETNSFGVFNNKVFQWLPVKVSIDPNDGSNYRRIVELL